MAKHTISREYTDHHGNPVRVTVECDDEALERWYMALATKARSNPHKRAAVGDGAIVVRIAD